MIEFIQLGRFEGDSFDSESRPTFTQTDSFLLSFLASTLVRLLRYQRVPYIIYEFKEPHMVQVVPQLMVPKYKCASPSAWCRFFYVICSSVP